MNGFQGHLSLSQGKRRLEVGRYALVVHLIVHVPPQSSITKS